MKKYIVSLFLIFILFLGFTPKTKAESLPSATIYYNQGIDFYNNQEIQKSIEAFKKAIELDPKLYQAYYNLAKIQESYKYYADALKTYEKLVDIMPEDYESIYNFGNLLYKRGYLKKSLTYLDMVPNYSEYYNQAQKLITVVEKRQVEVAIEERLKQDAARRSSIFDTVSAPSGIAADSAGNIYVASFSQNAVYKITPTKTKTTFITSQNLGGPIGIAVDEDNNVYVANYTKGNIIKATPNGKVKVLYLVKKPYCLSIDNKSKKLLITEQEKNTVIKYDISEEIAQKPPISGLSD